METAAETLRNMVEAFEAWLNSNIPAGPASAQGQLIEPLADPVFAEAAILRGRIESRELTEEQSFALVDDFSLKIGRAKLKILEVLGRSPEQIAARSEMGAGGGFGMLLVAGLAVGALIYIARK